jgi:predicted aspartyl protease
MSAQLIERPLWRPIGHAPICEARVVGLPVRALLDTGTDHSFLDHSVVKALGLVRVEQARVDTVAGSRLADVYEISLEIHPWRSGPVFALATDLTLLYAEVVIGRDVLQHSTFVYDPRAGRFSLAF